MPTHSPADAVEESNGSTLVRFDVSPNSSHTRVPSGFNEWRGRFEAKLSEPAQGGRANSELVEELENLFGRNARIVKGQKSRRKTVLIEEKEEDVLKILTREI